MWQSHKETNLDLDFSNTKLKEHYLGLSSGLQLPTAS